MTEFSSILADAFEKVAAEHGLSYSNDGALAWGRTGAAYLSFALCLLPSTELRSIQYAARETAGPVLLNCKWYDRMTELCMDSKDEVPAALPAQQGGISTYAVSKQLFLEMLDFCREG